MKIAQVVCVLPPYGGGIGVVAHHYAKQLNEMGHKVTVFTTKTKKEIPYNYDYSVKWLWPLWRIGNSAVLPQLFWRLRKFDIVHLHFPFFGGAIFVYLLKLFYGKKIKLVLSYHMDVIGIGLREKYFRFYNKFILHKIINVSDKIIVSSFDYIESSNVAHYYFNHRQKFVEIPFGVDAQYSPHQKNPSLLKKYHLEPDDKVIGFVGGLDPAHYFKGINYLITAISRIANPKVKALIVGKGSLMSKYQAQAKSLGVSDRVIFAGYVSNELLPEHYNLFDIFILPSVDKSEAFGLVLLEAMACGKPLIASNLHGVRSVVLPGQNGLLVEPKNPKDIVDKINYLLQNEKITEGFKLNGLQMANEKYRWPKIVDRLYEVYKSFLT